MPFPSLVLSEPMLQEAAPAQCNRKVLMVLSLFFGLGFAVLLGGQHLMVPTPATNMAVQPVKAQPFMQPARAWQPLPPTQPFQTLKVPQLRLPGSSLTHQSLQPAKALLPMQQLRAGPVRAEGEEEGGTSTGVLMKWMDDRGFGFIKPDDGSDDLFVHVRSLVDGEESVSEGNKVTYVKGYNDDKGKWDATEVRLAPGGEGDFRPDMSVPPPDVPVPEGGEGVLMRWMADRGFGFIQPIKGGDDIFCHVRTLVDGEGSVQEGNKVTYVPTWNARKGSFEAGEVRLAPGGEGDFRSEVPGGEPPPDQPAPEGGTGTIARWMDDRGFGFITPESGGDDIFCHVRSLVDGEGSVQEGSKVTFKPKWNNRQKKFEASEVKAAP